MQAELTVILATHNGARVLPRTLDGYMQLGDPGFPWKIVVVDNASTDGTPDVLRRYQDALPLAVLTEPVAGKNRALNRALSAIEGEMIVVTDDDAIPQPGFLTAWREAFQKHRDYDLFGATIKPFFDVPAPDWMIRNEPKFAELYALRDLPDGPIDPFGIFGPNMAVRRSVFDAGVIFSQAIGPNASDSNYPMGSENEFCYRASLNGARSFFVKDPVVLHIVRAHQLTPDYWAKRAYRLGRGVAHVQWESGRLRPDPIRLPFLAVDASVRRWLKRMLFLAPSLSTDPLRRFNAHWAFHWDRGFWREFSQRNRASLYSEPAPQRTDNPEEIEGEGPLLRVAVIIPFFQRQAGLLRKCIDSIIAQELPANAKIAVIIVDDGSPRPAQAEIQGIVLPAHIGIRVLQIENSGVSVARNIGLNNLPQDTQLIAFLDSDDQWGEHHLETAIRTLQHGYDLYFCDHSDIDQPISHFEYLSKNVASSDATTCGIPRPFITHQGKALLAELPQPDAFAFVRGAGLDVLIKYFLAHISTVVIRAGSLGHVRFNTQLHRAAEDYLYVLESALQANGVCFSKRVNMHRGRGVSIYRDTMSWDSEENLSIVLDDLTCFVLALRRLSPISDRTQFLLRQRIRYGRDLFTYLWARRLVKLKTADLNILFKAILLDPKLVLSFPTIVSWSLARNKKSLVDVNRLGDL